MTEPPEGTAAASVKALVRSERVHDIAAAYAEVGVDLLLKEGALRDIPVFGTLLGLVRGGIAIRDVVFARKLFEFVADLSKIDGAARRTMIEKLEADPAYGRRVGEHLLEILDRIDSHRKPLMIAHVFRAYAAERIDADRLHRLIIAIERVPTFDLRFLRPFSDAPEETRAAPPAALESLAFAGLLSPASAWDGMAYLPNELGQAFLELELDRAGEPARPEQG